MNRRSFLAAACAFFVAPFVPKARATHSPFQEKWARSIQHTGTMLNDLLPSLYGTTLPRPELGYRIYDEDRPALGGGREGYLAWDRAFQEAR